MRATHAFSVQHLRLFLIYTYWESNSINFLLTQCNTLIRLFKGYRVIFQRYPRCTLIKTCVSVDLYRLRMETWQKFESRQSISLFLRLVSIIYVHAFAVGSSSLWSSWFVCSRISAERRGKLQPPNAETPQKFMLTWPRMHVSRSALDESTYFARWRRFYNTYVS